MCHEGYREGLDEGWREREVRGACRFLVRPVGRVEWTSMEVGNKKWRPGERQSGVRLQSLDCLLDVQGVGTVLADGQKTQADVSLKTTNAKKHVRRRSASLARERCC